MQKSLLRENWLNEEVQTCPLCQTEYNDLTQVCPLRHCSNCGSLKLQTHKKRRFQSAKAKHNFVFILPPLGFFILVYGYLLVQGDLVFFLSIVAVYSVFFIGILFKFTINNIDCNECNAKNFSSVSDIDLNPINTQPSLMKKDEFTNKIAKTILEGLSKEQKKHNKKDIVIRIVGAVSLIIIALLGTFFVNPNDVLLGEIIDMIKPSQ